MEGQTRVDSQPVIDLTDGPEAQGTTTPVLYRPRRLVQPARRRAAPAAVVAVGSDSDGDDDNHNNNDTSTNRNQNDSNDVEAPSSRRDTRRANTADAGQGVIDLDQWPAQRQAPSEHSGQEEHSHSRGPSMSRYLPQLIPSRRGQQPSALTSPPLPPASYRDQFWHHTFGDGANSRTVLQSILWGMMGGFAWRNDGAPNGEGATAAGPRHSHDTRQQPSNWPRGQRVRAQARSRRPRLRRGDLGPGFMFENERVAAQRDGEFFFPDERDVFWDAVASSGSASPIEHRQAVYKAPPDCAPGYTRMPSSAPAAHKRLVCVKCNDELAKNRDAQPGGQGVWVAKCGHVYCGTCAQAALRLKTRTPRKGRCYAEGCARPIYTKASLWEVFL